MGVQRDTQLVSFGKRVHKDPNPRKRKAKVLIMLGVRHAAPPLCLPCLGSHFLNLSSLFSNPAKLPPPQAFFTGFPLSWNPLLPASCSLIFLCLDFRILLVSPPLKNSICHLLSPESSSPPLFPPPPAFILLCHENARYPKTEFHLFCSFMLP